MMTFLQIPVENRLSIFREAICSLVDPPSCPAASQEGRRLLPRHLSTRGGIWQPPRPRNPALSLLLVNKQTHTEVKDVLEYVPTSYHVDIMFLKSYGLWPTWTVPILPRTQYIDSVHATFRIFEPTEDLDLRFQRSLNFSGGNGGPPSAVWSFHNLLRTVFTYGPGYLGGEKEVMYASRYVAKRIIVDIIAPTDGTVHKSILWEDNRYAMQQSQRGRHHGSGPNDASIPAEQRLADYLIGNLSEILNLGYYTMDFGAFVYENVLDDITFLVNGKECKRYDMNKLMREHRIDYWGETPEFIERRQQDHAKWKTWVDERRERMREGLELDNNRPVGSIM